MDVVIYIGKAEPQHNQALWFVPDWWLQFTFCTGRVYARAQQVLPRGQLSHMPTSSEETAQKRLFPQQARNSLLLQNVNQLSSWIVSKNNLLALFFVVMPEAFPYGGSWRSNLFDLLQIGLISQKELYFEGKNFSETFIIEEWFTSDIRLNQLASSLGSCYAWTSGIQVSLDQSSLLFPLGCEATENQQSVITSSSLDWRTAFNFPCVFTVIQAAVFLLRSMTGDVWRSKLLLQVINSHLHKVILSSPNGL